LNWAGRIPRAAALGYSRPPLRGEGTPLLVRLLHQPQVLGPHLPGARLRPQDYQTPAVPASRAAMVRVGVGMPNRSAVRRRCPSAGANRS